VPRLLSEKLDVEAKNYRLHVQSKAQKNDVERLADKNKTLKNELTAWQKHAACVDQDRVRMQQMIVALQQTADRKKSEPDKDRYRLLDENKAMKNQVCDVERHVVRIDLDRETLKHRIHHLTEKLQQLAKMKKSETEERNRCPLPLPKHRNQSVWALWWQLLQRVAMIQ